MPQFMVLLHDRPRTFAGMSPEEMQRVVQRYMDWGRSLRSRRKLAGGQKLADDGGRILRRKRGKVLVSDGPYPESKEVLGGYFLIKAKDYAEAAQLSLDCPHLDYGGTIEVRKVDQR